MLVSEPFEIYKPDKYYKSYDIFHFDPTLVLSVPPLIHRKMQICVITLQQRFKYFWNENGHLYNYNQSAIEKTQQRFGLNFWWILKILFPDAILPPYFAKLGLNLWLAVAQTVGSTPKVKFGPGGYFWWYRLFSNIHCLENIIWSSKYYFFKTRRRISYHVYVFCAKKGNLTWYTKIYHMYVDKYQN